MEQRSIRQGSALNVKFTIPSEIGEMEIKKVNAVFVQRAVHIKKQCTLGDEASVYTCFLSQEDTLSFDYGETIEIQLKILLETGDILISEIMEVECTRGLSTEVMR